MNEKFSFDSNLNLVIFLSIISGFKTLKNALFRNLTFFRQFLLVTNLKQHYKYSFLH